MRQDNREGIHNMDNVQGNVSYGMVVNHNHYIDGPQHYSRNHEVTLYRKNTNDEESYTKIDCEMNVSQDVKILPHTANGVNEEDIDKKFKFDSFAYDVLCGRFDSKYVAPYMVMNEIGNVPTTFNEQAKAATKARLDDAYKAYRTLWYDGMLPCDWCGIVKLPNAIYYLTIKRN